MNRTQWTIPTAFTFTVDGIQQTITKRELDALSELNARDQLPEYERARFDAAFDALVDWANANADAEYEEVGTGTQS